MRALITGSRGFVGGYLRPELEKHGYEVIGLDLMPGAGTIQADLLDSARLIQLVKELAPDAVFHLAGQPDVGLSWKSPKKTMELNVIAAINLMEAVRQEAPAVRMVLVGSSDQYGSLGRAGESVSEALETRPQSPYAVSKKAQEEMARVYAKAYGMHVCMTRSFNHAGAGQRLGFMIPDFASGVVKVEKGLAKSVKVGNLTSKRDFTHVKDIAQAYRLIAERGQSGEVYNVGSGTVYSGQEILDKLIALAHCPIPVEQDPTRMRPSDTPVIRCDHSKLTTHTGWEPEIPLEVILRDALEDWRGRL